MNKIVDLKDFKREVATKDVPQKELPKEMNEEMRKEIGKIVITFVDGTTREIDKGMLLTIEGNCMGIGMVGLNREDKLNITHGFSEFALKLLLSDL